MEEYAFISGTKEIALQCKKEMTIRRSVPNNSKLKKLGTFYFLVPIYALVLSTLPNRIRVGIILA